MVHDRVTVFGGSGFLGRHLVKRLAGDGSVVRVAVRDPEAAMFLKPMGGVGQIVPVRIDVREEASVARAVEGAGAVVNAVAAYVETGGITFEAIHVAGARNVAQESARAGVARLVHLSGIGSTERSPSAYVQSRARGETAVKAAFEAATILRPSVIFGPEDAFFNTLAAIARLSPVLPLFGGGRARVQPVYVGDVAEAARVALADAAAAGATYELGGPGVYTYRELMEILLAEIGRRRLLVPVPFFVAELQAAILSLLPRPPFTRDQVELMRRDNLVGRKARTFADLGIEPVALETILPTYLARFRPRGA